MASLGKFLWVIGDGFLQPECFSCYGIGQKDSNMLPFSSLVVDEEKIKKLGNVPWLRSVL